MIPRIAVFEPLHNCQIYDEFKTQSAKVLALPQEPRPFQQYPHVQEQYIIGEVQVEFPLTFDYASPGLSLTTVHSSGELN